MTNPGSRLSPKQDLDQRQPDFIIGVVGVARSDARLGECPDVLAHVNGGRDPLLRRHAAERFALEGMGRW